MKINSQKHRMQLTAGQLAKLLQALKAEYANWEYIPIYLGDDDEINGVHCCWNSVIVPESHEDKEYWRGLINENYGNNELGADEVGIILC